MKKQTAVMEHIKWLYEVIDVAYAQQMNPDIIQAIEYVIEGAKAKLPMEKEQMMQTWTKAIDQTQERAWNVVRAYDDFDDYYIETYGKEETK